MVIHSTPGTPTRLTGNPTTSTGASMAKLDAPSINPAPGTQPPTGSSSLRPRPVCRCRCGLPVSPLMAKVPSSGQVAWSIGIAPTSRSTATTMPPMVKSPSSATSPHRVPMSRETSRTSTQTTTDSTALLRLLTRTLCCPRSVLPVPT